MSAEVHLEELLGRRVRARNGRSAGRLEEVHAEQRGDEWYVSEYLLGTAALLERLAVAVSRLGFGTRRRGRGWCVRWDQVDVSDPRHPRLTCLVKELRRLE